jgi:hypothetical protein
MTGHDRGVQADLGGQPGEQGVRHALRDEHRADGEAGAEVAAQVAPVVSGAHG